MHGGRLQVLYSNESFNGLLNEMTCVPMEMVREGKDGMRKSLRFECLWYFD